MKVYVIVELADGSYAHPFFLSESDALNTCEEIKQSDRGDRSEYEVIEVEVI